MAGPHGWVDGMRCIACGSKAVTERPERTAQGDRRFRCRACGKQFNERTGGLLNRTQYPSDVIALVVFWRLRYKLALRDLSEMFLVRGLVFSNEAVREWEAKLTPALAKELRRDRKSTRLNSSDANISYAVFCLKINSHNDVTDEPAAWRARTTTPLSLRFIVAVHRAHCATLDVEQYAHSLGAQGQLDAS